MKVLCYPIIKVFVVGEHSCKALLVDWMKATGSAAPICYWETELFVFRWVWKVSNIGPLANTGYSQDKMLALVHTSCRVNLRMIWKKIHKVRSIYLHVSAWFYEIWLCRCCILEHHEGGKCSLSVSHFVVLVCVTCRDGPKSMISWAACLTFVRFCRVFNVELSVNGCFVCRC